MVGASILPEARRFCNFAGSELGGWDDYAGAAIAFDLVHCRNLAFTYFSPEVQEQVLRRLVERMVPGGYLLVGRHEVLPEGTGTPVPYRPNLGIYRTPAST